MKKILLLLTFSILSATLYAQDFEFAQYNLDELNMTKYAKDTSAHAVVLKEYGKTWLAMTDEGSRLMHEYHEKIKIFDAQAFDEGTIEIPLYKWDSNRFDEIRDIEAVTYYKDENGLVQKSVMDKKAIFNEKGNEHYDLMKFTLPNLRKGCVIEFKYHLETPNVWTFKKWDFQTNIPKIHSEYEAHIPAIYTYNVSMRGPYKLTSNKGDIERDCFVMFNGTKCDCSKMDFVMTDIPAFVHEEFMTAPKNFLSAIYFELSEYYDGNGAKIKVAKDWKDVDYELKHNESFGSQIKRYSLMKDRTQGVIAGITDPLEKAKAIYKFVQKNFKWNSGLTYWADDGIKKPMDSHTGTAGEINLTMIAALNSAGINTEAVLLSTRDHGVVNKLYPEQTDFNYVVAKVNIGDKSYLLDATDPMLPFGLLPLRCINDQGRVMNMDKPSYWIDLAASEKKSRTFSFDLTLQEDGKIKGTMICYSAGYEALDKRKAIKKFNSVEEYVDDFDNKMKKIKILKSEIHNLDSLEKPLMEQYEIEIDAYKSLDNHNKLTFNPFILDRITENPFKLAERTYPIDRGAPSDDKFILNLHLPANYKVETVPENVALAMPLQGGRFLVSYNNIEDGVSFSHVTQFNKSLYSTSEYPYLKEMFNKIIQAQKAEIVMVKK